MPVRPLLALALAAAATACTSPEPPAPAPRRAQDGVSVEESGRPCLPQPAVTEPRPPDYPTALALPAGTVVTYVEEQPDTSIITGRAPGRAVDVLEHFRSTAEPAGFAVIRDEDEGRAGRLQLFGATTEVEISVATLTCPSGSAGFTVSVRPAVAD